MLVRIDSFVIKELNIRGYEITFKEFREVMAIVKEKREVDPDRKFRLEKYKKEREYLDMAE